jgi:hypothetical protein
MYFLILIPYDGFAYPLGYAYPRFQTSALRH